MKKNTKDRKENVRGARGYALQALLSVLSLAVVAIAIALIIYANFGRREEKQSALQEETVAAAVKTETETEADAESPWEEPRKRERSVEEIEEASGINKGFYALYKYHYESQGPEHTDEEVKKYDLFKPYSSNPYPNVSAEWRIEWPIEDCGLTPQALAKVRRAILWMCFCHSVYFDVPFEALGETSESVLSRKNKIDASEEFDSHVSHADYARLYSDLMSHKSGKKPAVEGDSVPTSCLELAIDTLKDYVYECSECQPTNGHYCSQFIFGAYVDLSWPFGLKEKEGAKWYERPVMCVSYFGYVNDGGNGNHDIMNGKVYSLPDGEELFLSDYLDPDKLKDFEQLLKERMLLKISGNDFYEKNVREADLFKYVNEVYLSVSEEGLTLRWWRNSIGCPEITVAWEDLEPFRK